MIKKITRRQFLVYSSLAGASVVSSRHISLALADNTPRFFFAVMSDPHTGEASWKNALTAIRNMKTSPDLQYVSVGFLLVTGDTNPIDRRFEDYTEVFDGMKTPFWLPVIGNHEADDSGGFPGGMAPGMSPVSGQTPEAKARPDGLQGAGMGGLMEGSQGPGDAGIRTGDDTSVPRAEQQPMIYANDGNPAIIDMDFIREQIIPTVPGIVRISEGSCTYYCDYKNIRVVSIDAYSGETGTAGIINDTGRAWAEAAISSASGTIDHIFVAFHAPAFPRVRHTHDSFNAVPEARNAFWKMLVSHRDKVRAVFCGHTHYYACMRVLDPAGEAANDVTAYPDETGGIYQVNPGSAGRGMKNSFVTVSIDGKNVCFRAFEAENGTDQPFFLKDEWCIQGN